MIRNYSEYKEHLYTYAAHLHSWGLRDPGEFDIGEYTDVLDVLLKRFIFITYLYAELLEWSERPQPFLVSAQHSSELSPPRGIASPVRPPELEQIEDDIARIFEIDFEEMTATVWPGNETGTPPWLGNKWIGEARARLGAQIREEHRDICCRMQDDEVLVPCKVSDQPESRD